MKKQQLKDLRNKSVKDLTVSLSNLKKEVANLKINHQLGKLKNVRSISGKKRDIAQTFTVLNQKLNIENITSKKKVEAKDNG